MYMCVKENKQTNLSGSTAVCVRTGKKGSATFADPAPPKSTQNELQLNGVCGVDFCLSANYHFRLMMVCNTIAFVLCARLAEGWCK